MTKEQAEKHGEVIKWWIDNTEKGVWRKIDMPNADWYYDIAPEFNPHTKYIQNDKYAEFRMAQADGKVIQYTNGFEWKDLPNHYKSWTDYKVTGYRIKPNEPEFKVNDWVQDQHDVWCQILDIKDEWIFYTNSEKFKGSMSFEFIIEKNIKLWKPTEDEWCVFWNDNMEDYVLSQYRHNAIGGYASTGRHIKPFDNIAPRAFIDTLK